MKISERMEAAAKLQQLEQPLAWAHTTRMGLRISLYGDQVSFTNEGDYVSLEEAREAIIYLAEQFGLEVKKRGKTKKN